MDLIEAMAQSIYKKRVFIVHSNTVSRMLSSPWGNLHSPGKGSLQRLHHNWYPKNGKFWGRTVTHMGLSPAP